ncbi:MAG: GIY-YIG nuclease family protein [Balneolaceae bacterium]|nr:MAG: GIY-YIG nuclease family protein [Balneolaceae bacterium]
MHHLYVLHSKSLDRYYVGQTKQVENRLIKHNKGHSRATKGGIPWDLVFSVSFKSKTECLRAENWLKKMKSRVIVEQVINGELDLMDVIK